MCRNGFLFFLSLGENLSQNSHLITLFSNVLIDEGWHYNLTSGSVGLDSRVADGEDHTLRVLWQKDYVALCQSQLLSQGFSEMSKACWLGTASPLLTSPRAESLESRAYWDLFLICWPENLCPSLTHFYPQKVTSWTTVSILKWHLPKEEFNKTEQQSHCQHQSPGLKPEARIRQC